MTPHELRTAAEVLFQRGVSQGKGPFSALAHHMAVPWPKFANWVYRDAVPVPAWAAKWVGELLDNSNATEPREKLARLTDSLVDDIMETSDAEILAEAAEDFEDMDAVVNHARELIGKAIAKSERRKR